MLIAENAARKQADRDCIFEEVLSAVPARMEVGEDRVRAELENSSEFLAGMCQF